MTMTIFNLWHLLGEVFLIRRNCSQWQTCWNEMYWNTLSIILKYTKHQKLHLNSHVIHLIKHGWSKTGGQPGTSGAAASARWVRGGLKTTRRNRTKDPGLMWPIWINLAHSTALERWRPRAQPHLEKVESLKLRNTTHGRWQVLCLELICFEIWVSKNVSYLSSKTTRNPVVVSGKALRALPKVCPKRHRLRHWSTLMYDICRLVLNCCRL